MVRRVFNGRAPPLPTSYDLSVKAPAAEGGPSARRGRGAPRRLGQASRNLQHQRVAAALYSHSASKEARSCASCSLRPMMTSAGSTSSSPSLVSPSCARLSAPHSPSSQPWPCKLHPRPQAGRPRGGAAAREAESRATLAVSCGALMPPLQGREAALRCRVRAATAASADATTAGDARDAADGTRAGAPGTTDMGAADGSGARCSMRLMQSLH